MKRRELEPGEMYRDEHSHQIIRPVKHVDQETIEKYVL